MKKREEWNLLDNTYLMQAAPGYQVLPAASEHEKI